MYPTKTKNYKQSAEIANKFDIPTLNRFVPIEFWLSCGNISAIGIATFPASIGHTNYGHWKIEP